MAIAFCPDCEEPVRVAIPKLSQRVTCQNCQAELEVIEVSPLELDWAYDEPVDDWVDEDDAESWDDEEEEDDDWDDDDWDDEDDENEEWKEEDDADH